VAFARAPLSIQTKWAVRYSAALLVSISIFAFYVYARIDRNLEQDARLVLELQAQELVQELAESTASNEGLIEYVERHIASAEPGVMLGIALYDPAGNLLIARGSLQGHTPSVPREVIRGGRTTPAVYKADLGDRSPYLVLATRAPNGIVQVAVSQHRFEERARHLAWVMVLALPLLLLLTLGTGWLLARGSLRPIAQITTTARRITGANLDERIPTTGSGDELDQLAATLNEMIARLRESMERMRQFSADAAHELRTPLAALRSQIEVTLEKERTPSEYRAVLAGLLEEVETLGDAVHAMLRLASSEAGIDPTRRASVALVPLLDEVMDFFEPVADEHEVELRRTSCPEVSISGDPTWLHQLFANLLHNAIKYTPAGGRVTIEAALHGGRIAVRVRDTGVGIPKNEQERVFARFHRTGARQEVPGAGLGLPIAREIARAHGGSIELESTPGAGSTFTVWLPLGDLGPPAA
jgi:heavy metal sensor kinase